MLRHRATGATSARAGGAAISGGEGGGVACSATSACEASSSRLRLSRPTTGAIARLAYFPSNPPCAWTESMDRFYSDCKLFVAFFKQRAKYMNASIEEQIAFDGHPATF